MCFLFLGKDIQLINCFWKIRVALKRAGLVRLVQANLLIWADSVGWTGWEFLTVLDEWKMALVTVLFDVERIKMVVACLSVDIAVHLESLQRDWIIHKCSVDFPPVELLQLKVDWHSW